MSDERRIAMLEVHAADLTRLREQIPALHTCQSELSHAAEHLQMARENSGVRMYAWSVLNQLADMHAAALQALAHAHDAGAHTLALSAIALAVDVLYVQGDPGGDRFIGALRHHLEARQAGLRAWQAAVPDDAVARQKAAQLATECRLSPWYADAPAWPALSARVDAVWVGTQVHSILSAAADAEQIAAQGVLDYLTCARLAEPERELAHAHRSARIGADALHAEAVALWLFSRALQQLAQGIDDAVALTVAQSALERLDALITKQHQLFEAHRNDDHIYIKVH